MPPVMALDVGEKTIGVAFSDESETLVFPGETILRREGKKRDMAALRNLIVERQVREIVVGLPLTKNGEHGVQADKVEGFIATLRNSVRIPIVKQDERFTTAEAETLLLEAGKRRDRHKETIDSVAACLILKDYLASKTSRTQETGGSLERPTVQAHDETESARNHEAKS